MPTVFDGAAGKMRDRKIKHSTYTAIFRPCVLVS